VVHGIVTAHASVEVSRSPGTRSVHRPRPGVPGAGGARLPAEAAGRRVGSGSCWSRTSPRPARGCSSS
jgi:hypothetical protein